MRVVFFFKQKTAYEVRISDWSSDVCSSDLGQRFLERPPLHQRRALRKAIGEELAVVRRIERVPRLDDAEEFDWRQMGALVEKLEHRMLRIGADPAPGDRRGQSTDRLAGRSEEHTSELQSLMRISYAVFCLKKK